jgi:putative PIN family toxin of toxin-antitoxin system
MVRAVLDSSVLVSAFLTPRGVAADATRAGAKGVFVACLSPPILAETAEALLRNLKLQTHYGFDSADVEEFCDDLAASAEMVADLPALDAVPGDAKDNPIVAPAVAARADHLVTGDRKHLLPLRRYGKVRIVVVRAFLELLGPA